ncbi:uncharacterized protein K460DRAFT_204548 [Cucurbitaria berberidis CBS 394.84]|uniref:Uncharacterized protein n=1 Tax=Cucurbitaria berberidis CBS 394.84 TaxID=1168544 RepID=A0A9P4G7J8_9PLEO|nr:uncharacterized protein K460DRAFT_204548 [Cucurbitaria berberidis CBS 394.84]KAF1840189.1 hypothetical protein K460DRAFT_204548 [Cucurbitaria berberidis CBS 394.84]
MVPAPLPVGFRIAPPVLAPAPVFSPAQSQLVPSQHQRSVSAPPGPCFPHNNNPPEAADAKQEGESVSELSAFQHWLSLFPESTIPMPFREALS